MGQQNKTLSFVLSVVKDSIYPVELKKILLYINSSSDIPNEYLYSFLNINGELISFELQNDLERLKKKNFIEKNGKIIVKDKKELSKPGDSLSFDIQNFLYKAIKNKEAYEEGINHRQIFKKREDAELRIYTSGYEGNNIDSFFGKLLSAGVRGIIDVRYNPVSRKFGFSKKRLMSICQEIGFEYTHFPILGIPSEDRKALNTDSDHAELFANYEKNILPKTNAEQQDVLNIMNNTPSTLICYEADPRHCHRSRLAKVLQKFSQLAIKNL